MCFLASLTPRNRSACNLARFRHAPRERTVHDIPNETFTLSVRDLEIIEDALGAKVSRRSQRMIEAATSPDASFPDEIKSEITELRDLLGRLWNQKTFYRPTDRFVGGG